MINRVFEYIDSNINRFVDELCVLCRQPSVSAQKLGLEETATMVRDMMEKVGLEAMLIPVKDGPPIVYGEVKSRSSRKTLLLYNHYDVQPPEPLEEWRHPPFEAVIEEGKIIARGASDNKGNIVSRLKVIEAFLKTTDDVPCNIKFVVEGEEEIGSPHFHHFIADQRDLLSADAAVWEFGGLDEKDRPTITLGLKGMLYVELTARGANIDIHSAEAAIIESPIWRLTWALNTLKDQNERILVEGWYDDVREFTPEELQAIDKMPLEEEIVKREYGISKFLQNLTGFELKKSLLGRPTCNIAGIISGYTGVGAKTVLPSHATAKIDFRLVPNQDPERLIPKLKDHLKNRGFGDIEVKILSFIKAGRTPITSEIVKVAEETAKEVFKREVVIEVTSPGSGPIYFFTDLLKVPTVCIGCDHAFSKSHAPNENLRIDVFRDGSKWIASTMYKFGGQV
ncbi:MAG: putative metallohydrolase [Candidatus Bathyarchaeota archaeon BA1]|nr:MAG: putative metallohydrolase [Candidatus Bathyarchaeota archaeon BA1]